MDAPIYRRLKIWRTATDLVVETDALARQLPEHERYTLASQLRRAAVSIPANIAEGNGRVHRGDYLHHLSIARGSLLELDTHLELALRLNYVCERDVDGARRLLDQVSRMLNRLIARLRS
ncbi:MAG TPA: four helix bundle protein [Gemmatimonadaceae bacterium]|nr:four helix bundle protein [Gemmatimonadaceae bacterium]